MIGPEHGHMGKWTAAIGLEGGREECGYFLLCCVCVLSLLGGASAHARLLLGKQKQKHCLVALEKIYCLLLVGSCCLLLV